MNNIELDFDLIIDKLVEGFPNLKIHQVIGVTTLSYPMDDYFICVGIESGDVGHTIATYNGCILKDGDIYDFVEFPTNRDRVEYIKGIIKKYKNNPKWVDNL